MRKQLSSCAPCLSAYPERLSSDNQTCQKSYQCQPPLPQPDLPPGALSLLLLTPAVLRIPSASLPCRGSFEIDCIIVQNICCSCIGVDYASLSCWHQTWPWLVMSYHITFRNDHATCFGQWYVSLQGGSVSDRSITSLFSLCHKTSHVPDRRCSISLGPITQVMRSRTHDGHVGWEEIDLFRVNHREWCYLL